MKTKANYSCFDLILEGVQVIDRDFRYLYVNPAAARQGKSTVEALTGQLMTDKYFGLDKTVVFATIRKCMEDRQPQKLINKFEFQDRSEAWFELSIQPVPEGVIVLSFDITTQKQAEKKLKIRYITTLEQKNRELEEFTGIVSHDLQAPLNTVTSVVELLRNELGENRISDTVDLQLGFITQSTQRMRELIKGLLEYAKIGNNVQMKQVDMQKIMEEICEDLSKIIKEKKARIEIEDLPILTGYQTELRLLLQNLILNAIKFQKAENPPLIKIGAKRKNGYWHFNVTDNGIGIDEKHKTTIFQLFSRVHADQAYEGSGIGLAHCYKIVKLHHGEISVDSQLGKGSTFHFTIPVSNN